jgi:DNA-directed RNA polymerase II subunit RPB1
MPNIYSKKCSPNLPIHKAKSIQFGILTEEDILRLSVCEVTSTLIYDKEFNIPARDGINDPRMGVSMRGLLCQTCNGEIKECPGHFGHIKLAEPVFHPEFLKTIIKILKCVCFKCYSLLVPLEKKKSLMQIKNKKRRLQEFVKNCSADCRADENMGGCGFRQPKYIKGTHDITIKMPDNPNKEGIEEDKKRMLRAKEVEEIFNNLQPDDIEALGLHREFSLPKAMIIKLLIVAPPAIRPNIELASSARAEDDLTHLYISILSTNIELIKAKDSGAPRSREDDIMRRLQAYVAYLMNNDQNKAKQKGGRPIKSISQRLKGKEGRLRGNLMGKRVDFSARTVVSPDPSLELDQLGVPKQIAEELTIPERVTQLNIDFLRKLVERGDEWPGARYYVSKVHDTEIIDLNYVKEKPNLQYGDIVERHLMDDDYVIFNRQPSLHKMSIMGHRIKVLPYSTFRLNLAVTTPYNADFDGDEMNMHAPQGLETKAEVKHLMHVPNQIVTPQSNRPVMGLNQDALLAIRLFTLRQTFINKTVLYDLLMYVENWDGELPQPAIIYPEPLWTGKQIISFIIPKMNYYKGLGDESEGLHLYPNDQHVIIRNGQLLVGNLNKSIVGNKKGSLIGCLWIDFGPTETKNFLTYSQRLVNCWLLGHGFTVGIADTIVSDEILERIEMERQKAQAKFKEIMLDTQKDKKQKIKHQPGKTIIESFENEVNTILNNCRSSIGELLSKSVSKENNIKKMILAGSKGNNINISQISGLVGQQNVEGKRVPFGFLKRSLPHFLKDDFGPESRGFVANSYYKGLTPEEFFFHTMGGREGLIDTAVKTSKTGYMQRKLVKALEDIMVQYDYSVRDARGNIVQFLYGEDGIAAEFIENQRFKFLTVGDKKLRDTCLFFKYDDEKSDLGFEDSIGKMADQGRISHKVCSELLEETSAHITLLKEFEKIHEARNELREYFKPSDEINILPVNINRLISQCLMRMHKDRDVQQDLNPVDVYEKLEAFLAELKIFNVAEISEEKKKEKPILQNIRDFSLDQNEKALFLFKTFLRFKLCSRKVILDYGFDLKGYKELLQEVGFCFKKSKQHPGEVCGSIAAQSIGETLTQMTLNTFHFAGVSSLNVTLGVPRIQEIINCAKNIKSSIMYIFMQEEFRYSQKKAQELITILELTKVFQLAKKSEIYYDPDPNNTIIPEDDDLLMMQDETLERMSPWVLRIEVDPKLLRRKPLRLRDITSRILDEIKSLKSEFQLIESLEIADPIVLRLREKRDSADSFKRTKNMEQCILYDMPIKGFCNKVSFKRSKILEYSPQGVNKMEEKEGEYVLETSGNQLHQVLLIPSVDQSRTYTNDINVMIELFGIEAGRQSILREIREVFNHFGIYVNYRHIGLLADIITSKGKLMAISRNGINKVYESPLRKCSFEQTVEVLIEAAVFADLDPLAGVSENIIMGQLCRIGTGSFDIIMDDSYFFDPNNASITQDQIMDNFKYIPDPSDIIPISGNNEIPITAQPLTGMYAMNTPGLMQTPIYNNPQTGRMGPNIFTPGTPMIHTPGQAQMGRPLATPTRLTTPMNYESLYTPYRSDNNPTQQSGRIGGPTSNMYNTPFSPMLNTNTNRINSPSEINNRTGNGFQMNQNMGDIKYTPRTPNYNPNISSPFMRQNSPTPYNIEEQVSGLASSSPYCSPNSNPLTSRSSDNMSR